MVQGTRERVLQLLIERRNVRVEELSAELGITAAAVRRHLDNLRADGLAGVRMVKQATGRPYHAYHPTELALGALPTAYATLLERMLRSLGEHEGVVAAVMESAADSLATKHRSEVQMDVALEDRVEQLTHSLRSEGILDGWRNGDDGLHLVNGSCPYRHAAQLSSLPCEADRKAIELLLGLDVEQLNRIVDGSPVCDYLVRAVRGPQMIEMAEGVQ